ncbi:hypothetical protein HaLaN_24994, partial [Haematococcus lacustris]
MFMSTAGLWAQEEGEPWNRLLVPGVFGSAHRLDAFLLKWDFEVLT